MARIVTNEMHYSSIASAIREKIGVSTLYKPSEMAPAILGIDNVMHHITVSPSSISKNGVYSVSGDVAFDPVVVNVDQNVDVFPTTITLNGGEHYPVTTAHTYAGFNPVTVSVAITEYYISSFYVSSSGTYYPPAGYLYNPITVSVPGNYELISSVISREASTIRVGAPQGTLFNEVTINLYGSSTSFVDQLIGGTLYWDSTQTKLFNSTISYIKPYTFCKFNHYGSNSSVYFPAVEEVGSGAFANMRILLTASFPACKSIGYNAFAECDSLYYISLPVCETVGSAAFYSCDSLTSLDFPSCTFVGGLAFAHCSRLQSVSLPMCETFHNQVFESTYISSFYFPAALSLSYTFMSNSYITEISLPACQYIGTNTFSNCRSLVSISAPNVSEIGSSAFAFCWSLRSVSFPVCKSINAAAFRDCVFISSIYFPECEYARTDAFLNCYELSSVTMPLLSIEYETFRNCWKLSTASFPNCTYIDRHAFLCCSKLSSLYLLGSSFVMLSSMDAFYSTPLSSYIGYSAPGSVFVPASLYDMYVSFYAGGVVNPWYYISSRIVSYNG